MENEEYQDDQLDEQTVEEVAEEEVVEEEQEEEETPDWEAEAKKWQSIAKRNQKKPINNNINSKLQDKAESPDDEVGSRISNLETAEKKRQFGYEHGLSPVETDKVFQVESNPTAETLKDPFVKAGLDAVKRQARVENNSPSTSAKSNTLNRKAMKDMSAEEKQAAYEKYMDSKK